MTTRAPDRWRRRTVASVLTVAMGLTLALVPHDQPAAAVTGSDFDPGYIISDENFFAGSSMTEAEIQTFLNSKVTNCQATDPYLPCLRYLSTSTWTRPATAYCAAYQAEGTETAARIIAKVGRACNISPKVLLVMLEKEQSLITSRKPTSYAYERAMGYACPDTAPCNTQYFGFFNQVYAAASRFQQYTATPSRWNYKIGRVGIQYHPNAGCGWNWVDIRNQATANLYIYTPYQPDAAALANLYGTGGSCSTYGNRNFWRLYNDWFGAPTASAAGFRAIDAEAAARQSILGVPTSEYLTGGVYGAGMARAFNGGSVYWTAATGAHSIYGAILQAYFGTGGLTGPLAWPTSPIVSMPQKPAGQAQAFQGGSVYSSTPTGTFAVLPPVLSAYFAQGGATGTPGWPTAAASTVSGGVVQNVEGGRLMAAGTSDGATAHFVPQAILTGYGTAAYSSTLGWPTSEASTIGSASQWGQAFTGGSVYSSAAGSFAVLPPLLTAYFAQGGASGPLGFPTGAVGCLAGVCTQTFTGGALRSENGGAPRVVNPDIENVAVQNASALGSRTSELIRLSGGTAQAYAKGSIYSSSAGTFAVLPPVLATYFSNGGAEGVLGYPAAAMTCSAGACSQRFTGGTVEVAANGTVVITNAAIDAVAAQESARLGARTSGLITMPGGLAQAYANGSVYSSSSGTFAVTSPFLAPYFALGGATGTIGYPTSGQLTLTGGTAQAFQTGSIYSSAAGTYPVIAPFLTPFFALGGATGTLGYPTSGPLTLTGGSAQAFTSGSVYSSAAGTQAVIPPYLAPYFALGGATGVLGYPTSAILTIPGGTAQAFAGGSIYSSTAGGTHAVRAPMLAAYWATGGATGAWGYPTGTMTCTGSTCTQSFTTGVQSVSQ